MRQQPYLGNKNGESMRRGKIVDARQKGRKRIKKKFDLNRMVNEHIKLYKELVTN